jgi:hypothetical protein
VAHRQRSRDALTSTKKLAIKMPIANVATKGSTRFIHPIACMILKPLTSLEYDSYERSVSRA